MQPGANWGIRFRGRVKRADLDWRGKLIDQTQDATQAPTSYLRELKATAVHERLGSSQGVGQNIERTPLTPLPKAGARTLPWETAPRRCLPGPNLVLLDDAHEVRTPEHCQLQVCQRESLVGFLVHRGENKVRAPEAPSAKQAIALRHETTPDDEERLRLADRIGLPGEAKAKTGGWVITRGHARADTLFACACDAARPC